MKCDLSLSFPSWGSQNQWSHTPLAWPWVLSHSGGGAHPTACHLIAAGAPRPDAFTVVAATPGCTVLPEVDEVHQRLGALDAHKAGRMPLLVVAGPVHVDHGAVSRRYSLAELTHLEGWGRTPKIQGRHESQATWVRVSTRLSTSWVTLNKLLYFSVPLFSHLQSGIILAT